METPKSLDLAFSLLALAVLATPCGATVIVADTFVGSSANVLNDTTASTFAAGVTSAGGSATWMASSVFKENGSVTGVTGTGSSAALRLGSYIEDAKGTPNGLFTLSATFSEITNTGSNANRWITIGFFSSATAFNVNQPFTANNGLATALRRDGSGTVYFVGPATGHPSAITLDSNHSNPVTFTIELDLRSYNPTTGNYGTVSYYRDGNTTADLTYSLVVGHINQFDFDHVGFSVNGDPNVTITNFTLSQIPEASSLAFAAAGASMALRRRRSLR